MMDAIYPLIGVVIGGLITYFATSATENRKWKRERLAKRQEHEREALQQALKWLDPIDNAIGNATILVPRLAHGQDDRDEYLRKFPNLLGTLAKLDLPTHQQVMLPEGTYRKGMEILRGLDDLKFMAQMTRPYDELAKITEALQSKANAQRRELEAAYRKTFE